MNRELKQVAPAVGKQAQERLQELVALVLDRKVKDSISLAKEMEEAPQSKGYLPFPPFAEQIR